MPSAVWVFQWLLMEDVAVALVDDFALQNWFKRLHYVLIEPPDVQNTKQAC